MTIVKIFISGGGDISDSAGIDSAYFSQLPENSKILYIPVAANLAKHGKNKYYTWFEKLVSFHSMDKNIEFDLLDEKDPIPDLNQYRSVYFGGGNTFKLLHFAKTSGLDQKLKEFLNTGGILYGGSAGAIILGKDIRSSTDVNEIDLQDFKGLNLFNNMSIFCHFLEQDCSVVQNLAKYIESPILALPENSGMGFDLSGNIQLTTGVPLCFNNKGEKIEIAQE